jgi:hypothetical protein
MGHRPPFFSFPQERSVTPIARPPLCAPAEAADQRAWLACPYYEPHGKDLARKNNYGSILRKRAGLQALVALAPRMPVAVSFGGLMAWQRTVF